MKLNSSGSIHGCIAHSYHHVFRDSTDFASPRLLNSKHSAEQALPESQSALRARRG